MNHSVARATVFLWLADEKAVFEDGKGVRKRPDIAELLKEAVSQLKDAEVHHGWL